MTTVASTAHPASRWWGRFYDLQGTPWEPEDIRNLKDEMADVPGHGLVIDTLAEAFREPVIDGREDRLEAVLRACHELWPGRWTPGDLMVVARGYVRDYASFTDALQEYADDHWPGLRAEWLIPGLKAVADLVKRESELWVPAQDTNRVYVFNRPS